MTLKTSKGPNRAYEILRHSGKSKGTINELKCEVKTIYE